MNRNTLVFPATAKYDVFQLKKDYAKNFSLGMSIAVLIHILLIGTYFFVRAISKSVEVKPKEITFGWGCPQPPINDPTLIVSSSGSVFKNLIPVPVPNDEVIDDKLLPTQAQISGSYVKPGEIEGANLKIIPPNLTVETPKEEIPDIKVFQIVEKYPQAVELITPEYPELARRAGLEGTVYLKVLIDKSGRPLKAVAYNYDAEIFVQPAINAAMKSVFTPAIQHKSPVMIWMIIPFKFRLNN